MGKLIVFEGLDGSGKSTQAEKLYRYLKDKGRKVEYIHFPTTNNIFGEMIQKYLKGKVEEDNPYFIASLYANDRLMNKEYIKEYLEDEYIVIVDRYVYSNLALQGSKLSDESDSIFMSDRSKFMEWVFQYEYGGNKLSEPDKILCFNYNIKKFDNSGDVLEDEEIQKEASDIYKFLEKNMFNMKNIEVLDKEGKIRGEEEIFKDVIDVLGDVINE